MFVSLLILLCLDVTIKDWNYYKIEIHHLKYSNTFYNTFALYFGMKNISFKGEAKVNETLVVTSSAAYNTRYQNRRLHYHYMKLKIQEVDNVQHTSIIMNDIRCQ